MKKTMMALMMALGLGLHGAAWASATQGTADEAKAMVNKAIAEIHAKGKDAAFKEFDDPANKEFHDRDLYVFVIALNGKGTFVAHGTKPALIGKDMMGLKDPDGVPLVANFVKMVEDKGEGWVDYKWPHPETKKNTPKSSFVKKDGDVLVGVGIYK